MSEEDDRGRRFDSEKNSSSINRRRFVKSLGVAGGALTFGSLGIQSAAAKQANNHKLIADASYNDKSKAVKDSQRVFASDDIQALAGAMEDETTFKRDLETPISLELTTTKESLNNRNPALQITPFAPTDGAQFNQNNAGIMFTLVADNDNERVPVSTSGYAFQQDRRRLTENSVTSGNSVQVKSFGKNDNEIGLVDETSKEAKPVISPQGLGCGACTAIISTACATADYVGEDTCVATCFEVTAVDPIFGAACFILCGAVIAGGPIACSGGPAYAACSAANYC